MSNFVENLDGTISYIKTVKPQDDFTLEKLNELYDEYMEVD